MAALRDAEEGPSAATVSRSGRTSDSDLPTSSHDMGWGEVGGRAGNAHTEYDGFPNALTAPRLRSVKQSVNL